QQAAADPGQRAAEGGRGLAPSSFTRSCGSSRCGGPQCFVRDVHASARTIYRRLGGNAYPRTLSKRGIALATTAEGQMVDLEKAGWNLAFGNLCVFLVACVITLAFEAPGAALLMG